MPRNTEQKIKLLVLYDILCKNTDEDHALNTDEIIAMLAEKNIKVARKVLVKDIELLNQYGYEVLSYKKKFYYYYVVNRPFENAEVTMLADVVKASKLDPKQKKKLIEKLGDTLSSYSANLLSKNIVKYDKPKRSNFHVIYSIDAIERAINENKKISFQYFSLDEKKNRVFRKDGQRYVVNPLVMVWDRDNYYLICYDDKHPDTVTYRIDRMMTVKVEDDERYDRADLKDFSVEEYRTQVFSMFGGEIHNVELEFLPNMLDEIYDKFGEDISIRHRDECFRVAVPVQVSKTFFAWVVGSQGKIKIISPVSVKEQFVEFINKIKEEY